MIKKIFFFSLLMSTAIKPSAAEEYKALLQTAFCINLYRGIITIEANGKRLDDSSYPQCSDIKHHPLIVLEEKFFKTYSEDPKLKNVQSEQSLQSAMNDVITDEKNKLLSVQRKYNLTDQESGKILIKTYQDLCKEAQQFAESLN